MKYYYLDNMRVKVCENIDEWTNHMRGVDPVIEQTKIGGVEIRTLFLAVDICSTIKQRPPLLFETVIFGGSYDEREERYASLGQAKCGHARWCNIVAHSQDVIR